MFNHKYTSIATENSTKHLPLSDTPLFSLFLSLSIFTKILLISSKKYGLNPGSGKNLSRVHDPGVKKAPDPDSQQWPEDIREG
jgi:hypothetical protein